METVKELASIILAPAIMGIFCLLISKRIDDVNKRIDDLRTDMRDATREIKDLLATHITDRNLHN